MEDLRTYASNTYSQFGEDGIIRELLRRIQQKVNLSLWCVEFGAWDGEHLSNTCNLIRAMGYRAVLIEGDEDRIEALHRAHPQDSVVKLQKFIEVEGPDSLDGVLVETPVPTDFDLLSIDIDGCDYWIWDSLMNYRPKVVVIEYNPTIPNAVDFRQSPDASVKQGSSARALVGLASKKGYVLVTLNATNLFFVRSDLSGAVLSREQEPPTLEELRDDSAVRVFAFSGYDGSIILSQALPLPWLGMALPPNALQAVPDELRTFPGDYSLEQQQAWAQYRERQWPTATSL